MNPAKPDSRTHGVLQAGAFLRGKLPAGPAGRNNIEGLEPVRISKAFKTGDRLGLAAVLDQRGGEFLDDLFRLVAIPSALKE